MKKILLILLVLSMLLPCALGEENAPAPDFSAIRINEFMASNGDSLEDLDGDTTDWIELYNTGDTDVNLQGLCLSDGKKELDKFVFPEVIIPAHGYLIVFASGKEVDPSVELHTSFKLSADGERVVLSYGGEILDIISFDAQEKDVAMARYDERSWRFTKLYTPGKENLFEE